MQQADARTYFTTDCNHQLCYCVTVVHHQRFHRTIEHLHSQNTMLLLVFQQILAHIPSSVTSDCQLVK